MYNEFANAGYESLQMVVGERMFNTTESQHLPPINVTYSHPWLSSITKIVPSPDWFVGFSDLRMISYDTETYYSRIVIQSYVWDSGTDDGQTYLAFDRDMDPQEPCQRFCVPSKLLGNKGGVGNSDANIITHHPNGNSKKCPDKEKGRIRIPQGHQFVDYTGTYIPYPAEYECILRVDDTEIFTGNEFNETQIRPPKNVKRPDDDFLDGLSPYDQPTYDNHLAKYYGTEPPLADDDDNNNDWNKNMLWIVLLILICCCPCACFGVYFFIKSNKKKNSKKKNTVDEFSVLEDEYQDEFLDLANTSYRGGGGRYDDDGNPIVEYDEDGNPIHIVEYDEDGNPIVEFDDDGNPIERYDENGMPIVRYDIDGNPIDYWDRGGDDGGDNGGGSDMRNSSRSMNSMRSNNSTRSTRSTRSTHSTHSAHSTRSTHEEAADNDYDSYLDSQRLKAEQENASYRSNRTTGGGGGGAGDSYRSNRSTGGGAGDSYRSHQML
jgi:YD repeat-containing protein